MSRAVNQSSIDAVLQFWFGDAPVNELLYQNRRKLWFGKKKAFDQEIRQRFSDLYTQAASGKLDSWQQTAPGILALILLLDQFPRNMFRHTPQAFATDAQALSLAKFAIDHGLDQALAPVERLFVYLPLEHSESQTDQQRSVQLFEALALEQPNLDDVRDYALRHQAVIDRFGRFPHRNRILGRETTPEEAEFLQQPGSSF